MSQLHIDILPVEIREKIYNNLIMISSKSKIKNNYKQNGLNIA